MARKRITEDDFDTSKLGVNPFVESLRIFAKESVTEHKLFGAGSDDEMILNTGINASVGTSFLCEVQNFTKLYHVAEHRKALSKLPQRAKELFMWLCFEVKAGRDYVIINIDRYKKENGVSHSSYSRAVDDLIIAKVLQPTRWQTVFWVNPAVFYNGNRIKRYMDNVEILERKKIDDK